MDRMNFSPVSVSEAEVVGTVEPPLDEAAGRQTLTEKKRDAEENFLCAAPLRAGFASP
jgi:hypothetical protein